MRDQKRVEIHEVMDRSEQGITKPFICRGEDGLVYFVKGKGAGRRSLICEWIAGHLGLLFGLYIAPFRVVEVPDALIDFAPRPDIEDLGRGPAFGSSARSIAELTVSHISQVNAKTQMDVLAYDWWVKNCDRTLSERGGNPNLFWDVEQDQLLVLDQNQAFDSAFDREGFASLHPFRARMPELFDDLFTRHNYAERFESAMAEWDTICDTIPPEWRYLDAEQTLPVEFDFDAVKAQLLDCRSDDFWRLK